MLLGLVAAHGEALDAHAVAALLPAQHPKITNRTEQGRTGLGRKVEQPCCWRRGQRKVAYTTVKRNLAVLSL